MKTYKILILVMGLLLTGCGELQVTIDEPTPTNLPAFPTSTATTVVLLTNTSFPTATLPSNPVPTNTVAGPTSAPPGAPSATQVPPAATSSTQQETTIFMIVIGDNGQSGTLIGCGDSAVPISVFIPSTQGILKASLEKLLSAKQQTYGEGGKYYNALYQSDLQVERVTIEQGKAIIHLTGTLMLGGVCDAPRVEAQIEQTALQFSTVNAVEVFVNDIPLEDVLSQR